MSEHTPTPWTMVPSTMGLIEADSAYPAFVQVTEIYRPNSTLEKRIAECNANAEFIVKAANAHDGLLKAVTDAQDVLAEYIVPDSGISEMECVNRLLAILDHQNLVRLVRAAEPTP